MNKYRNMFFVLCTHCMALNGMFTVYTPDALAVPQNVDNAWGTPQVIENAFQPSLATDQTFWLHNKHKPKNDTSEAVVMVYLARIIVENGGYFCPIQVRARRASKATRYPDSWTAYQMPSGDWTKKCYWLCEPGHSGENCADTKVTTTDQCNYTRLSKDTLMDGISYNEGGGLESRDGSSIEPEMTSNDYQGFFRFGHRCDSDRCEKDVILAAQSYLENGHGIIASPATVIASGEYGFWDEGDFNNIWDETHKGGNASVNISITANTGNYKTKTLCMPGFDGPGCTTSVCRDCEDPLTQFNSTTGMCSDCIDNYVHNDSGACVKCEEGTYKSVSQDKCIKCEKTEYFKDDTCVPRKQISKDTMYSCYPNKNTADFYACVRDVCDDDKKVDCVTADGDLGTKVCADGKWGACSKQSRGEK